MFNVKEQKAKIANFNARAERHGDAPAPAADIKLEFKMGKDVLDQFDPALRGMLYWFDKSKVEGDKKDLIDDANRDDPNYQPHIRFDKLEYPLKWDAELVGATVTIHYGTTGHSHIVLTETNVNDFRIQPLDGGTVVLTCRVQCHPDEKQAGKLFSINGNEFAVTIEPPSAEQEEFQEAA